MLDTAEEQISVIAEGSAAPGPSAPHQVTLPSGEVVTLYETVPIPLGMAAVAVTKLTGRKVVNDGSPFSDVEMAIIEGGLASVYLRFGIKAWTFRDAKGFPEPVTPENTERLLPFSGGGREVAEAADALYSDEVFRPFREAQARLSALMQMAPSTSPSSPTGSTSPTRSRRSSRTSSAGKRSGARGR